MPDTAVVERRWPLGLVESISLDEIVACLKRVRKSINRWTRTGGRQGYLTFVSQFVA